MLRRNQTTEVSQIINLGVGQMKSKLNEEIKSTHNSDDSISFKTKNSVDDKYLNLKTDIESNY
jgi:hypothetical protein